MWRLEDLQDGVNCPSRSGRDELVDKLVPAVQVRNERQHDTSDGERHSRARIASRTCDGCRPTAVEYGNQTGTGHTQNSQRSQSTAGSPHHPTRRNTPSRPPWRSCRPFTSYVIHATSFRPHCRSFSHPEQSRQPFSLCRPGETVQHTLQVVDHTVWRPCHQPGQTTSSRSP